MADCPSETGVHLIVDCVPAANNQDIPPSSMLSLKLTEKPALAEPTEDAPAIESTSEPFAEICAIKSTRATAIELTQANAIGLPQANDIELTQTIAIGLPQANDIELPQTIAIGPTEARAISPWHAADIRPAEASSITPQAGAIALKQGSASMHSEVVRPEKADIVAQAAGETSGTREAQDESRSLTQASDIKRERPASFWRISRRRFIVLAALVLGIRTFVGETSVVPTASMEGTILVGDHLFMDKLLYGPEIPLLHWRLPMLKTIHRGDIVVFRYPKNPSETYLKRVTAIGGDRVEIRDGVLYVNALPVREPYAVHHARVHNPQESWGPTVVPTGNLFVMGDNRDNSSDSRDWGFVPIKNVIGEPLFVYWSYDAPTARWLDENPAHRFSFYASIAGNFFSRTRWKRTGMLL